MTISGYFFRRGNNNNNNLFIYSALFNMLGDQKRITTINNLTTINTNIKIIQTYLRVSAYKNRPKSPINGTSRKIDFACILPIDRS